MARISAFKPSRATVAPRRDPESIRILRQMARSEEVRILLGDFFLQIAADEPSEKKTPHADLLRKMLGGHDLACSDQLLILAGNLDLLRAYDASERGKFSPASPESQNDGDDS